MLKNRKGFTLVELLSVIVILGIITGISIPVVLDLLQKNKQQKYTYHEEMVKRGMDLYVDQYGQTFEENQGSCSCYKIPYQALLDEKLIKEGDITCDTSKDSETNGLIIAYPLGDSKRNFRYDYYLTCKDKATSTIVHQSEPAPNGCCGVNGKFVISNFTLKINDKNGEIYLPDGINSTMENIYQEFEAISPYMAPIKGYEYSLDGGSNWTFVNGNSFVLSDEMDIDVLVRAVDNDNNKSTAISYRVRIIRPKAPEIKVNPKTANWLENVKVTISTDITYGLADFKYKFVKNTQNEADVAWTNISSDSTEVSFAEGGIFDLYVYAKNNYGKDRTEKFGPYKIIYYDSFEVLAYLVGLDINDYESDLAFVRDENAMKIVSESEVGMDYIIASVSDTRTNILNKMLDSEIAMDKLFLNRYAFLAIGANSYWANGIRNSSKYTSTYVNKILATSAITSAEKYDFKLPTYIHASDMYGVTGGYVYRGYSGSPNDTLCAIGTNGFTCVASYSGSWSVASSRSPIDTTGYKTLRIGGSTIDNHYSLTCSNWYGFTTDPYVNYNYNLVTGNTFNAYNHLIYHTSYLNITNLQGNYYFKFITRHNGQVGAFSCTSGVSSLALY